MCQYLGHPVLTQFGRFNEHEFSTLMASHHFQPIDIICLAEREAVEFTEGETRHANMQAHSLDSPCSSVHSTLIVCTPLYMQ